MMFVHHHRHEAPSVPHFLLGEDGSLPEGREPISPFLSTSTIPTPSAGVTSPVPPPVIPTTPAVSRVASTHKLKRPRLFLIQGELLSLTGDGISASLLGQLIYWSEKVPNFELFAMEEKRNVFRSCPTFSHGWFYKSLEELRVEIMVRLSLSDFYDILHVLIDQGWVQRKGNPLTPYKENQSYYKIQWRVPLGKICQALHRKGYFLPGFARYGVFPYPPKSLHVSTNGSQHGVTATIESCSNNLHKRFS